MLQTKQIQINHRSIPNNLKAGVFYIRMHKRVGGWYEDMSSEGVYIGASLDCDVRLKSIISSLEQGRCPYTRLQAKFDQYQRESKVIVSLVGLKDVRIDAYGNSSFLEDNFDAEKTLDRWQKYWIGQMMEKGQTLLNDRLTVEVVKVKLKMEALDSTVNIG